MVIRERRPLPNRSATRNERAHHPRAPLPLLPPRSVLLPVVERYETKRATSEHIAIGIITNRKNHPKMRKCAKFRATAAPPPLSSTRRSRAPKKSRIARRVHRNARIRKKNTTQTERETLRSLPPSECVFSSYLFLFFLLVVAHDGCRSVY